jgi:hypothetical protein
VPREPPGLHDGGGGDASEAPPQPFPFRKARRRSVMVSVAGMQKLVPYEMP